MYVGEGKTAGVWSCLFDGIWQLWAGDRMKIAICDDDEGVRSQLEKWISEFFKMEKMDHDIQLFSRAETVLYEMEEYGWFDVIFLDIELPRKSGIELAKTIREFYDSKCVSIIFISGKTEYCLQLFELEPLNFHAKPLQKEKIFKDLRKVMRRSEEKRNVIQYKEDGIIKGVLLRDVLYFEAVNKMVRLVLKSGEEIMVRIPLQDIYDRYRNYKIVRCHRSYVVNLSYVKKYYNNCFFMSNGDEIVVSKTYQKSIQEDWIRYDWEE